MTNSFTLLVCGGPKSFVLQIYIQLTSKLYLNIYTWINFSIISDYIFYILDVDCLTVFFNLFKIAKYFSISEFLKFVSTVTSYIFFIVSDILSCLQSLLPNSFFISIDIRDRLNKLGRFKFVVEFLWIHDKSGFEDNKFANWLTKIVLIFMQFSHSSVFVYYLEHTSPECEKINTFIWPSTLPTSVSTFLLWFPSSWLGFIMLNLIGKIYSFFTLKNIP